MRNKNRIHLFCEAFAKLWEQHPDLRFGQIISALPQYNEKSGDLFYLEEDEMSGLIRRYFDGKPLKADESNRPAQMRIEITSQHEIEKMAQVPFSENTALISIGNFGSEPPMLHHKPKHMLRLEFDDISLSEIDYEDGGKYAYRLFTSKQADRIAEFVYEHKSKIQTLICQCRFGQSRSAAVAAAIKEHIYHNGIDIFADEDYSPNTYVFRTVLDALKERGDKVNYGEN